jgi:ribonuclease HII
VVRRPVSRKRDIKNSQSGRGNGPGPCRLWDAPETDTFFFEQTLHEQGYKLVAGLDEVGRGPLAGPVVAACVVLPADCRDRIFRDSKQLSPDERLLLYDALMDMNAALGIGICTEKEIDMLNILQASLQAMRKAIAQLTVRPDFLLVDGTFPVPVSIMQQTLIKGELKSVSIAAASIVAKVTRDRLMEKYHQQYPRYNFKRNKGYATAEHRRALREYGPCAIHRRTFRGVREYYDRIRHGSGGAGSNGMIPFA